MHEMMSKLLASKKKEAKMSPMEKETQMSALKELKGEMNGHLKGKLDGGLESMKKVTVAAPDAESLEAGLDKAKDMVENHADYPKELDEASPDENMLPDDMSAEQIDKMLMMLMEKKKELSAQKGE